MTNQYIPTLIWGANQTRTFTSLPELEHIVSEIESQSIKERVPIGVQVALTSDTSLLITVGTKESHLEFYSAKQSPFVASSQGPWDDDDLIDAMYLGDEISSMERRYCVPFEEAHIALRLYYKTRSRPTNIKWSI